MENIFSKSVESLLQITLQNYITDYIEANSAFRLQSGQPSKVVRVTSGKCCKWCSQIAGTYIVGVDDIYNVDGKGHSIFQRHENCDCLVTWHDYKGIRNVHTKELYSAYDYEREKRKLFSLVNNDESRDLLTQYIREAAKKRGDGVVIPYGMNLKKHKDEITMANVLKKKIGGVIEVLEESTIDGEKMPDYLWDSKLWELKTPKGMNGVDKLTRKAIKQIGVRFNEIPPGGIVFDISRVDSSLNIIERTILERVKYTKYYKEKIDIILVKNNKLIKIVQY